jgi:hypothetical protein
MSSDKLQSVKNWQNSVNIDYLSLYIKTWFAFLATAQEMHPTSISPKGDGALIEAYIQNMVLPTNMDSISIHLHKAYTMGFDILKSDHENSFYGNFFSTNSNFAKMAKFGSSYTLKLNYKEKLGNNKNPNIYIVLNTTVLKFQQHINKHFLDLNIPLTDFINIKSNTSNDYIFLDTEETIKLISDRIDAEILNCIQQNNRQNQEKIGYCRDKVQYLIHNLRANFVLNDLFTHNVNPNYYNDAQYLGHEKKLIEWFIKFNYHLRNLLFHSVINPFDEKSLKLFKQCYLVLREIVEHNIKQIENSGV